MVALLSLMIGCDRSVSTAPDAAPGQTKTSTDSAMNGHNYSEKRLPSTNPPGGLRPEQVPLFIAFGWDDNGDPSGLQWSLDLMTGRTNPAGNDNASTFDGTDLTATYYNTSSYVAATGELWKTAWESGHEIGNHTQSHGQHLQSVDDLKPWQAEIDACTATLVDRVGIPSDAIVGFRTPFLGTSEGALAAVYSRGFDYDCSLEEGFSKDADGTNFIWPYTLDNGSPGNSLLVEWGAKKPIQPKPGLWEMPVYAYVVPPDHACERYGVEVGLRDRLHAKVDYFDPAGGQITGFDYNLWVEFEMTAKEVTATLKYSLDQRLAGNRAPFLLGVHSDEYAAANSERRPAIREFLDYALTKADVRVVSTQRVLAWLRDPVAL